MKTFLPKKPENYEREWKVVDATDQSLGRLAVKVACMLRGKDKPTFTPHIDMGDFVVVVNADKVKLTGKKEEQKIYQFFSGYRGGQKRITAEELRARHPDMLVRLAVERMLPSNKTSNRQVRRLKIYTGSDHPHEAQIKKQ